MAQGEPLYDIIDEGVSSTYLDQIYSQGMVMDMNDPAIKDIIKFDTNPWKTQSDYGRYNGVQYGVCFVAKNNTNDMRNAVLFNKDLAKQFELGDIYQMVKDGKWTWSEFEKMCEKIKQKDANMVPAGYQKENLLFPMTVFSNGGRVAVEDENGKLKYVANTDEKTLAAYEWVYQLRQKGYLAPDWTIKDADGKNVLVEGGVDYNGFAAGKCVFWFGFYGDLQKLTQNSSGSDGNQTVTNYHFGLLPHPIGPDGDKCHGVTYSVDIQMICTGVKNPEEVAAVLVAIANRTSKTPENIYEEEAKNTLEGAEDLDMLKIMYTDMRSDISRTVSGQGIGGASDKVLKLAETPAKALEAIAEETQALYDGTLKKNWVEKK